MRYVIRNHPSGENAKMLSSHDERRERPVGGSKGAGVRRWRRRRDVATRRFTEDEAHGRAHRGNVLFVFRRPRGVFPGRRRRRRGIDRGGGDFDDAGEDAEKYRPVREERARASHEIERRAERFVAL